MKDEIIKKEDFKPGEKVKDKKGNTLIVSSIVGNEIYVESKGRLMKYYRDELSKTTE